MYAPVSFRYLILLSVIWTPLMGLAPFQPPVAVQQVNPRYPEQLMYDPIPGEAVLMVVIDEEGSVAFVDIESATHEAFGQNSIIAAYQWKFEPAYRNGEPVRIKTRIPFQFTAPTRFRIFQANVNPLVGYEVWKDNPGIPVPGNQLTQRAKPSDWKRPPYPQSLEGSGLTPEVKVRFLVSPHGIMHNPTLVELNNTGLYLDAARFLASLDYQPARDSDGNPCWSRLQRIVRFQPPPFSEN